MVIERLLGSNGLRCSLLRNIEGWEFQVFMLSIGLFFSSGYGATFFMIILYGLGLYLLSRVISAIHSLNGKVLSAAFNSTWSSIINEVNSLKDKGVDLISHYETVLPKMEVPTRWIKSISIKDEMLRLQGLGSNTPTGVPYTEDEIMAIVRGGKQPGHIPGVGRDFPGQGTIIPPPSQSTHSMLTQLESQPEYGGGSGSGGCGDDEPGDDEDGIGDDEEEDDISRATCRTGKPSTVALNCLTEICGPGVVGRECRPGSIITILVQFVNHNMVPEKEKVTVMILYVDLKCPCCYKKVKKLLCKFPQIRDQVFDVDNNKVTIAVVCCDPEKLRDKLCCKESPKEKPPKLKKKPKSPPPESKKTEPDPPVSACCQECYEGRNGGPCHHGYGRPVSPPVPVKCEPYPPKSADPPVTTAMPPVSACCQECNEGRDGGPCHHGNGRPVPPQVPVKCKPYPPKSADPPRPICCQECYEGRDGGPCHHGYGRPVPPQVPANPKPYPPISADPPRPTCCQECYEGRDGGPCHYGYGRPVPQPVPEKCKPYPSKHADPPEPTPMPRVSACCQECNEGRGGEVLDCFPNFEKLGLVDPENGDDYIEDPNLVTLISKLDISSPLHLHHNDSIALTVVIIKLKET
nr:protein pyricularia oryzae resistance 21-like [Tanacetum cinerariifolium]